MLTDMQGLPKRFDNLGGIERMLSGINNSEYKMERVSEGYYIGPLNHTSLIPKMDFKQEYPKFDIKVTQASRYDEFKKIEDTLDVYGVCDGWEQFDKLVGNQLRVIDTRKFFVVFTVIRKCDQSDWGGWRWHKWGNYIGEGQPTTEYLYDEPEFEEVWLYHIYEVPC